jgi:hypothetical protein
MKCLRYLTLIFFLILSSQLRAQESRAYPFAVKIYPDRILSKVISPPQGYSRIPEGKLTDYQYWVVNFPMLLPAFPITTWDGQKLFGADSANGVINFGIRSPQQRDADIPIQMIACYLLVKDSIWNFPFVVRDNDTIMYSKFLSGQYVLDSRRKIKYVPGEVRDSSQNEFNHFLQLMLDYTNNRTLLYNMDPIEEKDIVPGTFYIQLKNPSPDTIGHTAVILDVCYGPTGDMKVLAGWGGDPATLFYVARPLPPSKKQWFSIPELKKSLEQYGEGKFYRFKM